MKFFVGQPVRINCPQSQHNHGKETRVTALNVATPLYTGTEVDLPTRPDNLDSAFVRAMLPLYPRCVYEDHELEPILPEGAAPSEFETLRDLLDGIAREQSKILWVRA